jgi:hypothetical protein
MRKVRSLGLLLALSAVAALSVAAAPASASTVLCKTSESPCSAQKYPAGTEISGGLKEGTQLKFVSGFTSIQCSQGTISAGSEAEAGSPLPIGISKLALTKCTNNINGGSCSAGGYALPRTATLAATGSNSGTLEGAGIEFTCEVLGGPRTCRYTGEPMSFNGGAPASLVATNSKVAIAPGSSTLCSSTGTVTAEYRVSSPASINVETGSGSEEIVGRGLCAINALPCPVASRYLAGQALKAPLNSGSTFIFSFAGVPITCTQGGLEGEASGGSGLKLKSVRLNGCTNGQTGSACLNAALAPGEPSQSATATGEGNGTINGSLTLAFECFGIRCKYAVNNGSLPITGGNPAQIHALAVPMSEQIGSGLGCQNTIQWSANFTFSTPSSLFIE